MAQIFRVFFSFLWDKLGQALNVLALRAVQNSVGMPRDCVPPHFSPPSHILNEFSLLVVLCARAKAPSKAWQFHHGHPQATGERCVARILSSSPPYCGIGAQKSKNSKKPYFLLYFFISSGFCQIFGWIAKAATHANVMSLSSVIVSTAF